MEVSKVLCLVKQADLIPVVNGSKVKTSAVPPGEKLSCSSKAVSFSNHTSHCPAEMAADNTIGNFIVGDSSALSTCTTENLLRTWLASPKYLQIITSGYLYIKLPFLYTASSSDKWLIT